MWNGCKGISIGYFSQSVENVLKKVIIGYVEGEKLKPRYKDDCVKDGGRTVGLNLQLQEGQWISLSPSGMKHLAWFQAWADGGIDMELYKEAGVE